MILCLMWGLFLYYIETCKSMIIHQGAISIIISDWNYSASENLWSLKVSGRLFNYKIEILKGNSVIFFFLNFAPLIWNENLPQWINIPWLSCMAIIIPVYSCTHIKIGSPHHTYSFTRCTISTFVKQPNIRKLFNKNDIYFDSIWIYMVAYRIMILSLTCL